jgi:hypothetical protein
MIESYYQALNTRVYWWQSAAEFARTADQELTRKECNKYWTGETWRETVQRAVHGTVKHVPAAEKLLDRAMFAIDTPHHEWVAAVAGAFPIVPEVLAGRPDPMRRKVLATRDSNPLRIFVDMTSSGGITTSDLLQRGVAYLALAMALSTVRAVELYVMSALGGDGISAPTGVNVIAVPANPLDMATACNAMTSTGLCRGIGYSWCHEKGGTDGCWGWGEYPSNERGRKRYVQNMRTVLGGSETDLIVPPAFLYDEAIRNPLEFLKRSVAEHTTGEYPE